MIRISSSAYIGATIKAHTNGLEVGGRYRYTGHLLALETCKPEEVTSVTGADIVTPLQVEVWEAGLAAHPDRQFAEYILRGLRQGFRIGFDRAKTLVSATSNMAIPHEDVVQNYLEREVSLGRMYCVREAAKWQLQVQISPLGMIPKKNKPGKWRLIVLQVGQGALLVKADIKEAYRNIPVHPEDQQLLGIRWNGWVYIDRVLPFGLRSAPKIFSAVADAAQWMMVQRGISDVLHYLDDFALVAPDVGSAQQAKGEMCRLFSSLGLPLEPNKLEGPSTCLTFLGIEVDTVSRQLRLPAEKMERLDKELRAARGRRSMLKRELQSLTGLLQHACKVVRPGRAFLQRLYAMQSVGSAPSHNIRLNTVARADIVWWQLFVSRWNGVSMIFDPRTATAGRKVVSDASGSWGAGAVCLPNWLLFKWPPELQDASIQVKELVPVVVAAALYGRDWKDQLVVFLVDNQAVVEIINKTHSKESHLMHLVRLLVFFACHYNFWFRAEHVQGRLNTLADALSRNNLSRFFSQQPPVCPQPSNIPAALLSLLALNAAWTSTPWMELFRRTLQQV